MGILALFWPLGVGFHGDTRSVVCFGGCCCHQWASGALSEGVRVFLTERQRTRCQSFRHGAVWSHKHGRAALGAATALWSLKGSAQLAYKQLCCVYFDFERDLLNGGDPLMDPPLQSVISCCWRVWAGAERRDWSGELPVWWEGLGGRGCCREVLPPL